MIFEVLDLHILLLVRVSDSFIRFHGFSTHKHVTSHLGVAKQSIIEADVELGIKVKVFVNRNIYCKSSKDRLWSLLEYSRALIKESRFTML